MARSAAGQQYIDAILVAGGAPVLLPIGLTGDVLDAIYEVIDGLLLPGGDDVAPQRYGHSPHPRLGAVNDARDDFELTVARRALSDDLPILGKYVAVIRSSRSPLAEPSIRTFPQSSSGRSGTTCASMGETISATNCRSRPVRSWRRCWARPPLASTVSITRQYETSRRASRSALEPGTG